MSFQQGLSGLNATSQHLQIIGNNIANANTYGSKVARAEFSDVYATALNGSGTQSIGIGTTLSQVAQQFSQAAFLIAVNLFLLAFGIFIEPLPGVMVLAPILAPVAVKLGVDPTHFAMIVIYNLTLGMITPPVGSLLFVTSNVAKVPMATLVRELKPFLVAHAAILLIITFVPALSTWLPHRLGFR